MGIGLKHNYFYLEQEKGCPLRGEKSQILFYVLNIYRYKKKQ